MSLLINLSFFSLKAQNMEAKEAIDKIDFFVGEWKLESSYLNAEGKWINNPEGQAKFTRILKGLSLLDESGFYFFGQLYNTRSFVSYDILRDVYRQIIVDDVLGYPDVHEGKFEEGLLVMSNIRTGTAFIHEGKEVFYKTVYEDVEKDSFIMSIYSSGDKENWTKVQVIKYLRKV